MKQLSTMQVIALSQLDGVGAKTVMRICEALKEQGMEIETAKEMHDFLVMARSRKLVARLKEIAAEDVNRAYSVAKRIIEDGAANGIFATSYLDDEYPQSLLKTVDEKGNEAVPVVMYYKGDISITQQPGIAVIGTREPTNEGERVGTLLASRFAEQGFNIVSGLAVGCDTCGHLGALSAKGKTTAILAHGLTTVYPPQNEQLATRILENGGLLLSEYPIGTSLTTYNLVARDRLQSGLSKATLVIQTGRSGGTMHAVHSTLAAQKPLYVVRYQDTATLAHEKTAGNEYLAQREAKYISETDDIAKIAARIKSAEPVRTSLFDF